MLLPYVSWIGTPSFQRRVVEALPSQNVQRLREISDVMHARSVQIFEEKRAALARGDDAMHQQVGEGRDVMSILCESFRFPFVCLRGGRKLRARRLGGRYEPELTPPPVGSARELAGLGGRQAPGRRAHRTGIVRV